jgi:hypothetical protein
VRGTQSDAPLKHYMACLLADELELTPEQRAFLETWAKRLNVSVEVLIDRIVVATIEGFLYTERIPNYCP